MMPSIETEEDRLLLYIDILGFSKLVEKGSDIKALYEKLDRMNVFGHDPYFKCIVFSDTILVYSEKDWKKHDRPWASLMWMCEFAQDVFYRFIRNDIHFRAILTAGRFERPEMKNIDAYFGEALVRAYKEESRITGTGLFMDRRLSKYSRIFKLTQYSEKYDYVHLMQSLDNISVKYESYPYPEEAITSQGLESFLIYDLIYLRNIHSHINDMSLPNAVRSKYSETWRLLRKRHRDLLDILENEEFDFSKVSVLDWDREETRLEQGDGFHG